MAHCAHHRWPSRRHHACCRLFGAEKIIESLGEFLGYFMVRKVAASEELLRASGTIMAKADGLAGVTRRRLASRRARGATPCPSRRRDLPRGARLASVLFYVAESGPTIRIHALDDADYIEDDLTPTGSVPMSRTGVAPTRAR